MTISDFLRPASTGLCSAVQEPALCCCCLSHNISGRSDHVTHSCPAFCGRVAHVQWWSAGVWLHGEAVAAGMVMAADMSHGLGWIDESILDRTRLLLQRAKLPVEAPQVRAFAQYAIFLPMIL